MVGAVVVGDDTALTKEDRITSRTPTGIAVAAAVALSMGACDAASPSAQDTELDSVNAILVEVAVLDQPLAIAIRPDDPTLYVAEKTGRLIAIRGGSVDPNPVLDISRDVSLGGEQGLLGAAFSPDGKFLYVDYTDANGDTHVTEFAMDGRRADVGSRRDVLFVAQPYTNHNGGGLAFGPDGYLYIALGDGGSGGDPHGNGQSLSTLLGKLLRISPRPSGDQPYTVPADNPFVDDGDARPEIWAYGLRNPFRFSFDRATGDLWIGDVGQSAWEEVDMQPVDSRGGENYGWNVMEGDHEYGDTPGTPEMVPPIYEYANGEGACVVTGGYVYRGRAIPALQGAYVFGDFCGGRLEAIQVDDGQVIDHRFLGPDVANLSSFGEDASGELYALSLTGGVYKLSPVV
jgi:glucose/arabinose dehydrogenase